MNRCKYSIETISSLKDIEIGDLDANKIPEEKNYLLPVMAGIGGFVSSKTLVKY
jgi:hypothetical protein